MDSEPYDWLPNPIPIGNFDNDWTAYIEHLYTIFCKDFVDTQFKFNKKIVIPAKHPWSPDKKHTSFWHLITRDTFDKKDRQIDKLRCERVPWPKPIILNTSKEKEIRVWEAHSKKKNRFTSKQKRTKIWLVKYDYMIILANEKNKYYFITAYLIEPGRKRQLEKKFKAFVAQMAP